MNALLSYQFDEEPVRVVMIAGEPWFAASDVGKALGYEHTPHLLRLLDDDEKGVHKVDTLGGPQEMAIISESGLYHAALKRRGANAQRFRRWVTQEVLPSIRKTGRYELPTDPPDLPAPPGAMDLPRLHAALRIIEVGARVWSAVELRQLWAEVGLPSPRRWSTIFLCTSARSSRGCR